MTQSIKTCHSYGFSPAWVVSVSVSYLIQQFNSRSVGICTASHQRSRCLLYKQHLYYLLILQQSYFSTVHRQHWVFLCSLSLVTMVRGQQASAVHLYYVNFLRPLLLGESQLPLIQFLPGKKLLVSALKCVCGYC